MADDKVRTAVKRSPEQHQFAFMFSDLPKPEDEVVDGNTPDREIDGNDR